MPFNKFKLKVKVFTGDCDVNFNIKPQRILQIFQELAILHADKLGFGYEQMKREGRFWALTKMKVNIIRFPTSQEEVIAETTFYAPEKFVATREFCIKSKVGEVLATAVSKWCVVNIEARRLEKCEVVAHLTPAAVVSQKPRYNDEFVKLTFDETAFKKVYSLTAAHTHVDINNHVNNTEYINFAINALGEEFKGRSLEAFELCYVSEVKFGNKMEFYLKNEGAAVQIVCRTGDKTAFTAHLVFKEN